MITRQMIPFFSSTFGATYIPFLHFKTYKFSSMGFPIPRPPPFRPPTTLIFILFSTFYYLNHLFPKKI